MLFVTTCYIYESRVVFVQASNVTWFIHDTFIMHFRYKLWQRNIFSFIFLDRSFDFQWILLMVPLSICYIYDTFLMHSWYIHDTSIQSLNENDSTSYILLQRKIYIFHTTSSFKRPNISRNTRWNCNFCLPLKNFTSQASLDPNSTSKARTKQSPLDLEYFIF